ncbi:hypothetical protein XENOCAPTIV_024589 [Xenoophorus captivus]|uniref:Uncharacterized protein n=1 Tax=Xenoophorus captivus TaxID=1517983 RepID=A0ABV0SDR6_9TELE
MKLRDLASDDYLKGRGVTRVEESASVTTPAPLLSRCYRPCSPSFRFSPSSPIPSPVRRGEEEAVAAQLGSVQLLL